LPVLKSRNKVVPVKGAHPVAKPLVVFGVKPPSWSASTSPKPKPPKTAPVDDTKAADPASPGTEGPLS
jgi:hypothetical protein